MNRRLFVLLALLEVVSLCVHASRGPYSQLAELNEPSAEPSFDHLGFSVATNGSITVVAGGATSGGTVYVFTQPSGGWVNTNNPVAYLTSSDRSPLLSVALIGNTVVSCSSLGVCYVYVMPSGGWVSTSIPNATLTASDHSLLTSVAITNTFIVAGAPDANGRKSEQGAAYVFVEPQAGWAGTVRQTAKLTASNGNTDDRFGVSVSASGDIVFVGAPDHAVGTCPGATCKPFAGAAYIYVKPQNGWTNMSQSAQLTSFTGGPGDNFGASMCADGSQVLIGASQAYTVQGAGKAYIFTQPQTGWATTGQYTAKLTSADGKKYDYFGSSVALSTNTAVVGTRNAAIGTKGAQGGAYVYVMPPTGWKNTSSFTAKLTASDGTAGDNFGSSVAINGSFISVGAPYHSLLGSNAQGAAYMF